MLKDDPPIEMTHLKDRGREMIRLPLDKNAATGDTRFILTRKARKTAGYKEVQRRIRQIIEQLEARSSQ